MNEWMRTQTYTPLKCEPPQDVTRLFSKSFVLFCKQFKINIFDNNKKKVDEENIILYKIR